MERGACMSAVAMSLGCWACAASCHPAPPRPRFPDPGPTAFAPVDEGVDPCTDFAAYACGPQNELAASGFTRSDDTVARLSRQLAAFVQEQAGPAPDDETPASAAVRTFALRCSDPAARKAGVAELLAELGDV